VLLTTLDIPSPHLFRLFYFSYLYLSSILLLLLDFLFGVLFFSSIQSGSGIWFVCKWPSPVGGSIAGLDMKIGYERDSGIPLFSVDLLSFIGLFDLESWRRVSSNSSRTSIAGLDVNVIRVFYSFRSSRIFYLSFRPGELASCQF
jgi:hypothetical protein